MNTKAGVDSVKPAGGIFTYSSVGMFAWAFPVTTWRGKGAHHGSRLVPANVLFDPHPARYIPLTYPTATLHSELANRLALRSIMEQGAVFKSNRSQAIRIPKAAALPDDVTKVDIVVMGRARIISPAGESWDCWFDGETVTDDYMEDREQPAQQEREAF